MALFDQQYDTDETGRVFPRGIAAPIEVTQPVQQFEPELGGGFQPRDILEERGVFVTPPQDSIKNRMTQLQEWTERYMQSQSPTREEVFRQYMGTGAAGNITSAILGGLSGFVGKEHPFEARLAAAQREGQLISQDLRERERHKLQLGEAERKGRQEKRKEEAYAQIEGMSFDPTSLEPENLWKMAGPLIKAGDTDAGMGLLKLGIEARKNDSLRGELTQVQSSLSKAKTADEANAVLGSLSPAMMKEHGGFLTGLVKRRFPDEQQERLYEQGERRLDVSERNSQLMAQNMARQAADAQKRFDLMSENQRINEERSRRLLPSQQKILTGNRVAIQTIDNYEKAYDEFIKESKGAALSDILRGGIAKNLNAQRAADLVLVQGRTPAEKKLAAEHNAMIGSVKTLTDEVGVLTNEDVPRIMASFNPAVERGQFKANIAARRRIHQRTIDTAMEDYQAMGKDVSGFKAQGGQKPVETYVRDPKTGKLTLQK